MGGELSEHEKCPDAKLSRLAVTENKCDTKMSGFKRMTITNQKRQGRISRCPKAPGKQVPLPAAITGATLRWSFAEIVRNQYISTGSGDTHTDRLTMQIQ